MTNKKEKSKIIKDAMRKYSGLSNAAIARKIKEENKLVFVSAESVRSAIRQYKGVSGKKALELLAEKEFLSIDKLTEKYNLPPAIETEYIPFNIISNKTLIFSDVHIPFYSKTAIMRMFDYTVNKNIEAVILNGDIMDCFEISDFCKTPDLVRLKDEIEYMKIFLKELKRVYPKATIYYKFGNHEKRFDSYIKRNAPELWGIPEIRLDVLLDLFNIGIKHIPEEVYINLFGLSILHGHEYKNGITSPANPARTAFLRSKSSALVGHNHQTSEHSESRIDGEIITCWSIGCMCELHPEYMPLNKWNLGFAIHTKDDDKFWHINNHKILKGRIV